MSHATAGMDRNLRYVKEKRIAMLLNEMVVHLLAQKPPDPTESLVEFLEAYKKAQGQPPAAKRPSQGLAPAKPQAAKQPARRASAVAAKWSEPVAAAERNTQQAAQQTFAAGTAVELHGYQSGELDGKRGISLGVSRGRVAVSLPSGEFLGVPAGVLRKVDLAAQLFPVGTRVEVVGDGPFAGAAGIVQSHFRGRAGVELETGSVAGFPVGCLKAAGRQPRQAFPIGALVQLLALDPSADGLLGIVLGHNRGRVGVQLLQSGTVTGRPATSVRLIGKSGEQMFPVGTRVVVQATNIPGLEGSHAVVTGHARGRVGVEFADGRREGLLPQSLRRDAVHAAQHFPVDAEVRVKSQDSTHFGALGYVQHSGARGRVSVRLADGTVVGIPPEQLERVTASAARLGDSVEILSAAGDCLDGKTGRVVGASRGRLGVELDDGSTVGIPAQQARPTGKSAAQAFVPNTQVQILSGDHASAQGRVTGTHRGRVGVSLDNGVAVGVPPGCLRRLPRPAATDFPAGTDVTVKGSDRAELNGKRGKVVGQRRGRVGVELANGDVVGIVPAMLLKETSACRRFPVNSEVEIVGHENAVWNGKVGKVEGHSRGRVGVRLLDGSRAGVVPEQLRSVGGNAQQKFPVGCEVVVADATNAELNGRCGRVTGLGYRNRAGVTLDDGRVVGVPHGLLRKGAVLAEQALAVESFVEIISEDPKLNGRSGRVSGVGYRNRVGVTLDDGTLVGIPHQQVRPIPKMACQKFCPGDEVILRTDDSTRNGRGGRVTNTQRGRVGVVLDNGVLVGVPAAQVQKAPLLALQRFAVGTEVVITADSEHNGATGRVVGQHRNRIGVELRSGATIGVPHQQARAVGKNAQQTFAVNAPVTVVFPEDHRLNGRSGVVTGWGYRNRLGVSLEDGEVVGLPKERLRLEPVVPKGFPVGSEVVVVNGDAEVNGRHGKVVGSARGRIGVELRNGVTVGVPEGQLRVEQAAVGQRFPMGTEVVVISEVLRLNGKNGRVTGHGRGRVGVTLEDGESVGLPFQCVRRAGKNAQQSFAVGAFVVVDFTENPELDGRQGTVTGGGYRNRLGVTLENGEVVGLPAHRLRPLPTATQRTFPVGCRVTVLEEGHKPNSHAGKTGTVTGTHRGRVGVELSDGTTIGVPAGTLTTDDRAAPGVAVNARVVVSSQDPRLNGKQGVVQGISRGRVGVALLGSGEVVGVPVACVSVDGAPAERQFAVGSPVECTGLDFNGQQGTVIGTSRGRVGVELPDGSVVGVAAGLVRAVRPQVRSEFARGAEVEVSAAGSPHDGLTGRVVSTARGRVSVSLLDGSVIGIPAAQLRLAPRTAAQQFQAHDSVVIVAGSLALNGQTGTVTGVSRGRVGVLLSTGGSVGVPSEQLRHVGKTAAQAFSPGAAVDVLAGAHAGQTGVVTGVRRGRVGVALHSGATVAGCVPSDLRAAGKPEQMLPAGRLVQVHGHSAALDGTTGIVVRHSRGRVAVKASSGEVVGVPYGVLRPVSDDLAAVKKLLPAGSRVEVLASGEVGTVQNHSRGRAAVDVAGEVRGYPCTMLRVVADCAAELPTGAKVAVHQPGSEHDGLVGTVASLQRGRVGVELDDGTTVGVPPSCLRKECPKLADAFPVGSAVNYKPAGDDTCVQAKVTGHFRGRVGIEYADTKVGVVPAFLES
ncbi:hypothetical protein DIPPA_21376 [Diplonema papillatum]|nr:hypothetical protein DIPPA_21376 [Diplonema papillatum]